jgi:regulator of protease activity HflC (stomatin/prohibitin superfamily)
LLAVWRSLLPFVVLDEFEAGVVLRLGRPHRDLGPGFHPLIPFAEQCLQTNTVPYLHDLPPQSVGPYVFRAVVTYSVVDPRRFLLGVEDGRSAIEDACLGALCETVDPDPIVHLKRALRVVKQRVKHWGIEVDRLSFADHTKTRTYRLIQR